MAFADVDAVVAGAAAPFPALEVDLAAFVLDSVALLMGTFSVLFLVVAVTPFHSDDIFPGDLRDCSPALHFAFDFGLVIVFAAHVVAIVHAVSLADFAVVRAALVGQAAAFFVAVDALSFFDGFGFQSNACTLLVNAAVFAVLSVLFALIVETQNDYFLIAPVVAPTTSDSLDASFVTSVSVSLSPTIKVRLPTNETSALCFRRCCWQRCRRWSCSSCGWCRCWWCW